MEPAARERLLEAALVELGAKGREAMSVEAVLAAAAVAEDEFAAAYVDLDACLDDAYERLTKQLDAAVRLGCATAGSSLGLGASEWPGRVRGGLEALLAELAGAPEVALALTGAYPALGPAQQARYQAFVERLAPQLRAGRELGRVEEDLPGGVDLLAIGAAEAIVVEEIRAGRAAELGAIGPAILFSLLVPFLGPAEATAAMERARAEH